MRVSRPGGRGRSWRHGPTGMIRDAPPQHRLHVKYFGFVAFGNDVSSCVCVCVYIRLCVSLGVRESAAMATVRGRGRVGEGRMIIGLQQTGGTRPSQSERLPGHDGQWHRRGSRVLRPLRARHTHGTPTDRRWGFGMTAQHSRRIWALYSKYTPETEKHTCYYYLY